jgi:anti-sigma factor (TIGR02949 family)
MNDRPRMGCEEALLHLFEYINRCDLTADDAEHIRRHIEACRPCWDRFEFEKVVIERLKTAGSCKCPATLVKRVLSIFKGY